VQPTTVRRLPSDRPRELEGKGAKPGTIEIQEHDGKKNGLYFVRECDMLDSHDSYCSCFGQPAKFNHAGVARSLRFSITSYGIDEEVLC